MDLIVLADPVGRVDMTIESVARVTNVPLEIVTAAVCKLCKPDVNSRSPDHDGRRLVPLDEGRSWGWQIVNFGAYHGMRNEVARRDYMRVYMQRRRKQKEAPLTPVNIVNTGKHSLAHIDVNEDVNEDVKKKTPAASPPGFNEFWQAYPNKKAPKAAKRAWEKATDKPPLATILEAIHKQAAEKERLREAKQFCPPWKHPATWINAGCWDDAVEAAARTSSDADAWNRRAEAFARIKPGMVANGPDGVGKVHRVTSVSVFVRVGGGVTEITDLETFRGWSFVEEGVKRG
jgi:hypothetical protein